MKNILTIAVLIALSYSVSAQKLIDIYKKGTVHLISDTDYAKGNDWNKVFETYNDTLYGKPMGNRKSLLLMPDGSVVVNHPYRNYYSKFSPSGKFEKEFGVKNTNGLELKKVKEIEGIINDNFYTGLDNMGNMVCFDFDGSYIKTLKLNYMTRQMITLPNNKIAVVGWVIWETKFRDFVAIVDYNTNSEKVIWEHFTDRCNENVQCKLFNYTYSFKTRGAFSIGTMPFSKETGLSSPPQLACVSNKLIIALPGDGQILVYSIEGKLIGNDQIDWANNYISVDEQKEIQQKAIDRFSQIKEPYFAAWVSPEENKLALATILEQMKSDIPKITEPIPIPTFSTIIKDSDGNLLFFEYPKEENANKFNVWIYDNGGKFVCQSSFACDDYELEINPSKMVFDHGYIYGLQKAKNVQGVPLRLVRFKIDNN
jgi:hypothetical protein